MERRVAEARRQVAAIEARGARFVIVEGRFYDGINDMLLQGARRALEAAGAEVDLVTVAGALEIPVAVAMLTDASGPARMLPDGVVVLGCVIRGETSHYDIVAGESARALVDLAVARRLALGNGILTVENEAQALERADPARLDKGGDAARAALGLLALRRRLAAGPLRSVS